MSNEHYDMIIIGTGAGRGRLAHRVTQSGENLGAGAGHVLTGSTFYVDGGLLWSYKEQ